MPPLPLAVEARLHHGTRLISSAQIAQLGHRPTTAADLAADGQLRTVLPGVHAHPLLPPSETELLDAALLSLNQGRPPARHALVTGSANLALRRVEGFGLPVERPTLVVPRGRRVRRVEAPFDVIERARRPGDIDRVRGRPVTAAGVALADAALDDQVAVRTLRVGAYELINDGALVPVEAAHRWRQLRGHAGARRLLDLYGAGDLDVESEGERSALRRLFLPHPPAPDCQVVLVPPFRADFAYVYAAMTLEYLGAVHRAQLDRDATRRLAHQAAGYLPVDITAAMLRDDPSAVAAHIHELRLRREALTRRGLLPRAPLPAQRARRVPLATDRALG